MKDIVLHLTDWHDKINASRRYIDQQHNMRALACDVWKQCEKVSQFMRDANLSSARALRWDREFSAVHNLPRLTNDVEESKRPKSMLVTMMANAFGDQLPKIPRGDSPPNPL